MLILKTIHGFENIAQKPYKIKKKFLIDKFEKYENNLNR